MTREELEKVRAWANDKIATGAEPPWAWQQLCRLRDTIDAIVAGMDATQQTASLQATDERRGSVLRLVAATDRPDTARHHFAGTPVRLPT